MGYTDPEKAAAYAREWRAKHADKVKEDDRQRRAKERVKDPSAATRRMREWREANPEQAKVQAKIANEKYKARLRTDPVFKEEQRTKKAAHLAIPEVRERRRTTWKEWRAENKPSAEELRVQHLGRSYGLTPEQYESMVAAQEGKCAICRTDTPGGKGKRWHIDHCHVRGQVRELLCHSCNTGLGLFKDDPVRLQAAIAYIERHHQP